MYVAFCCTFFQTITFRNCKIIFSLVHIVMQVLLLILLDFTAVLILRCNYFFTLALAVRLNIGTHESAMKCF